MARRTSAASAFFFATALYFASTPFVAAQGAGGPPADGAGREIAGQRIATPPGIPETTDQLMRRQAAAPPAGPRMEHELEYPDRSNLPQAPGAQPVSRFPAYGGPSAPSASLSIHTTANSFNGATLTDTGAFPPDSMGTAGPTQFMVFVNGRIRTFTKAGAADGVINADPDVFFASVMTPVTGSVLFNFTSDPQVRYDRFSGRWFMSIIDVPCTNATCTTTAANRWLLAVSDAASNGTISGSTIWTFFQFQADAGTNFCDYPSLGIDVNALYVGCNMFTSAGSFAGTNGYVVQKASTLAAGPIVVTSFANLATSSGAGPFAPRGVDNFDPSATAGLFVGVDNATFSTLMFRRVSNPGSLTPTISTNIAVAVLTTTSPNRVEHAGNTGGANGNLDSLDDRLYAATIRNGRLWTAHNFRVSSAGAASTAAESRNAVRWYEFQNLDTTPTVVQSGTVFDSAATRAAALQYWIPSATVTGQGHAVLAFTKAGTPSGATPSYVGRLAGDTLGTMQAPPTVGAVDFGTTTANYNPPSDPGGSFGRRWGDYSFTVVDPIDDMTVWTIQEYNQAANSYAVRVGRLQAPPPATPTCTASPIPFSGPTGNVTINATSSGGSGFYDPGANLPAPARPFSHLSASVSNATVNSATYNSPTQVTLNITASTPGLQNVTITNPDGQNVVATGCIDVSISAAASVTFTTQPAAASNIAAGATIPIVAHVVNGVGDPVAGESITLSISTNPGSSALTVTTNPVVTNASGDATFAGVSLNKAGSGYKFTATDTTTPSATAATSNAFDIVAGSPASISFTTQPAAASDVVAGTEIPLVAHVQDANANPIAGDDVTLSVMSNPGSSTLGVTTNPVATDASGDAAFAGVTLDRIGSGYTLKVADGSGAMLTATGNAFNIVAAAPDSISFTTQPSDAQAGVAISPAPAVAVIDAFDNPVAGVDVTLAIANNAGGSGVLSGGGAQMTDALGVATFAAASIDVAGAGYTLDATVGSLSATSDAFDIVAGQAAQLAFTTQPADVPAGDPVTVEVSVTDAFGNLETADDTTQVSLSVAACQTTVVLGTTTVAGGVASFPGLRFRTVTPSPSDRLRLDALSDTALTAKSNKFSVDANPDVAFYDGFEVCVP